MRPKALIIDDNEPFVYSLERALRCQYEIEYFIPPVIDPADATIEYIKNIEQYPDSIILEASIGKGQRWQRKGIEVLKWLRLGTAGRFSLVPVIMTSCESKSRLLKMKTNEILGAPGSYFVQKPLCLKELETILAEAEPLDEEQRQQVARKHLLKPILYQRTQGTHNWMGASKPLDFGPYKRFTKKPSQKMWQAAIDVFCGNRPRWVAMRETEFPDFCVKTHSAGFINEAELLEKNFKSLLEIAACVKFSGGKEADYTNMLPAMKQLEKILENINRILESIIRECFK